MLQCKAHNVVPHATRDDKGPPSITALRMPPPPPGQSPLPPPVAVRVFHRDWTDEHLRGLTRSDPQQRHSVITRCLTVSIPSNAAASYFTEDDWMYYGGVGYGTDLTDQFLLTTPWDQYFSAQNLDLWAETAATHSPATTGFDDIPDCFHPFYHGIRFYTGRIYLTERGEYKVRELLGAAAELWQTHQIMTEIELGNELNFFAMAYGNGQSYPRVMSVPFMPDAYASLFYEICKIASEPQFLVFQQPPGASVGTPSGRIPILSGGFAQYLGNDPPQPPGGFGVRSLMYKWSYFNTRNPFHPALNDPAIAPTFPENIRAPQEDPDRAFAEQDPTQFPTSPYRGLWGNDTSMGRNPDRRYVWDWLDAYFHRVATWDDGQPTYPGQQRGQGNGRRRSADGTLNPNGVIDDLDGFAFHLYVAKGQRFIDGSVEPTGEFTYDQAGHAEPTSIGTAWEADERADNSRAAFLRAANQFMRLVADSGPLDATHPWGYENNWAPDPADPLSMIWHHYPAYYRDMPFHATEFSFQDMYFPPAPPSRSTALDGRDLVKRAYQKTVEYYESYSDPVTDWPRTRLGRIYHWADDPVHGFDHLCAVPGNTDDLASKSDDGRTVDGYYLSGTSTGLPAPGDFHRALGLPSS